MSDLIPSAAKTIYKARMQDIFDTWKRPHTFSLYKTPTETIAAIDDDYSSNWRETDFGDTDITYTEVKETFEVRIWFPNFPQKFLTYQPDDVDIRVKMAQKTGSIKIQCEQDCYDFLVDAQKAVLFDQIYNLSSDIRRIGLFDMNLFTFEMSKQN